MHIGVFFAERFEEIEAVSPVDILKRAGHEVFTVSVGHSHHVMGSHGMMVKTDYCIDEIHIDNFDMIVLPGGPGHKDLEKCDKLMRKVKKFNDQGKYIAAICAAPTILGRLGILAGKKATCFPGYEGELKGAECTGSPAEIDGHVITGRSAGTAVDFSLKIVEALAGHEAAEKLAASIFFDHFE